MSKLVIIGGGASGLAAAIAAACTIQAKQRADKHLEVVLCEAADRVGKSILATGNGRCNFSNSNPDPHYYWNGEFVGRVFEALESTSSLCQSECVDHTAATPFGHVAVADNVPLRFFDSLNLAWREEAQGKLYPLANKSSVVLDVLRARTQTLGICELCEQRVVSIRRNDNGYTLSLSSGETMDAAAVVLACGGRGIEQIKLPAGCATKLGKPVLGPLRVSETSLVKSLDNVRVRSAARLLDESGNLTSTEIGEVLFRPYGVSGIAIFNLSRLIAYKDQVIELDFIPALKDEDALEFVMRRATQCQALGYGVSAETILRGLVLPPVARAIVKAAHISSHLPFQQRDGEALAKTLKHFVLHVQGIGDERQCQVMRGGLDVASFNVQTLEANKLPGLFACGEALDVDGPCGGFNLHWAWASGLLAGSQAALKACDLS